MAATNLIQAEQFIDHPPDGVWKALTTPALLAEWWAAGDIRPEVGHRFTIDMGAWGLKPCEVLAVDPERAISYVFAAGTLNTIILWRLEPEGPGTRLVLEHRGFDLYSPMGQAAFQAMSQGWPVVLARIGPVLSEAA